jgi:exopolysaccharide biosynthesis WecB/TagA/CpsF family protein
MKVSIITVCLNSQKTIQETFNSVLTQNYKNIEHIIIDGNSTDATKLLIKEYPFKNKKIFIHDKLKLYESLNLGIDKSTGDYIFILHSDDVLNNPKTISNLVEYAKKTKSELIIGSIVYFRNSVSKIVRFFSSVNFKSEDLLKGLIPPHTGMFIKRSLHKKFKYKENYKIAGDFEFFLRCMLINKVPFITINEIVTRMKTGGISGKNIASYFTSSKEIKNAFYQNNLKQNFITIYLRFFFKIKQLLIINELRLNKNFIRKVNKFYLEKLNYDFFIYKNFNKIFRKKKFILSAMNLAFLGSFLAHEELKFPHLYHWPDGISAKLLDKKIKKIPGREILQTMKINKKIKRILVIGNLSSLSKKSLFLKFNKKIINFKVPYANYDKIAKSIKFKPRINDLIFITLPTPKQELVAMELAKKFENCQIICIGGSIAIFSGEEKEVPLLLNNFEFIWRLQYETWRRVRRLTSTFFNVLLDYIWSRKIKKLNAKIQ